MIDVAVIGCGAISGRHIGAYLRFPTRCRIVALVDIVPAHAEARAAEYGLDQARIYPSLDAFLADGPRAHLASVATPPSTHAELTCTLLGAGVDTLCEKPMAASLEECDAMLAAASAHGRMLSIVAQNRFGTDMQRLKHVLSSGVAGRVAHAEVNSYWWRGHSYYDLWWRGTWASEGGGCTLNHAVHHLDALQWMLGAPTEITAAMTNVQHDNAEIEDLSIAILRFGSGALGQVTSSVVHHGQEQRMVFQTERARLSMPWSVYASVSLPNGFPERDPEVERRLQACADEVAPVVYTQHEGQIDDVLTALETGGRSALVDGEEGRKTLEIVVSLYKAAVTHQPVRLPLAGDDPFATKAGLLARAPHFHEKSGSVAEFSVNTITTSGDR